ncbi:dihydroorotate dehydrogenase [Patescibacteria group bacterium]|nr:dihydroorotate dehydrogenase [Patescibacteria group bacterium]MBU1954130.1 dihydroorotate dehydrogenase [Patescibacteria group bacterium]
MTDLKTEFCGVKFENPLVVASGVLGVTGASLRFCVENGAGGVTTKSIWLVEHKGHKSPVIIANEHYMLNAVGVPDAGIEKAKIELGKYMKNKPAPLIANIIAGKVDDYAEIAEKVTELGPDIIEVNISCPNVEDELGRPFACSRKDAARVTEVVRKRTKLPIVIKLSPNVESIVEIARACVDAGADGICAINTVGPGMAIDIGARAPILANKVGGLSGPAIKPLSIKAVYDIHKALPKVPIIGTGGIITGEDAIEMIMAGATLVGMGTAVYYRDVKCFGMAADEMRAWCEKNGVKSLDEIRGAAHGKG